VCIECQSRRDAFFAAECVVDSRVLVANSKVRARLETLVIWYLRNVPGCEARRIAVISTLTRAPRPIQESVEVHLFAWVVLIDRLVTAHDVVHAVFNGEDAS
jgi:hypothetical protein